LIPPLQTVKRFDDPVRFLAAAEPLLAADEARHNLLFGLLATLRDHPGAYPVWHLWLVEDAGVPVGAALQTPPHNLVIARPAADGALQALATAITAAGLELPGVSAARPEVEAFAGQWAALTGCTWVTRMEHGIYALRQTRAVVPAPGVARQATTAEVPLIARLVEAFEAEAMPGGRSDPDHVVRAVATRLGSPPARGGFWLWETDGEVVSLSGHGGPTPNGIRIGPVYTPPRHRGRGYATSLVAAESAWLLANGHRFCFLYADLANPISNHVYRRIGYELVCEAAELAFEADRAT